MLLVVEEQGQVAVALGGFSLVDAAAVADYSALGSQVEVNQAEVNDGDSVAFVLPGTCQVILVGVLPDLPDPDHWHLAEEYLFSVHLVVSPASSKLLVPSVS